MSNGPLLTIADANTIRSLIAENPRATCKWVASKMGRHSTAIQRLADKHGIEFPRRNGKLPVRVGGPLGKLMQELDDRNILQKQIAAELHVDVSTYSNWRAGRGHVPYFVFEALAEIAGYEIVLQEKRPAK